MISQVSIRNFQSLKSLDLELGPFTVIVGNSSTGKSAFVRALKAVAFNIRGTTFVTSGASSASISATSESWKITLERGSSNSYKVCDLASGTEKEFTKLAGEVPSEITDLLGILTGAEGKSVNFAGEREQPYLLDDSGQQVAKVLGDLTHVSTLLEAIRESNRRRAATNSTVKIRQADFDQLKIRLPEFTRLPEQKQLLEEAETLYAELESLNSRLALLTDLVGSLERLVRTPVNELPSIPDASELFTAYARLKSLSVLYTELCQTVTFKHNAQVSMDALSDQLTDLEQLYKTELIRLGECPTCQRPI